MASVGIGGGKGKEQVSSPAADTLANLATQFAGETTSARQSLLSAMEDVLKTGGSKVPIISRAVEQSRQEGSKALASTDTELAQQGLAGTPFGVLVKSLTRQQGNIAAGQTQQSLAQSIFNMIPNFILGQGQTALSGLAGAIPGMNTTKAKGTSYGGSQSFSGKK